MSPTPAALKSRPGMLNIYGAGAHLICYQVTDTTTSWAITQRNLTAAQETWRIFTPEAMTSMRTQLLEQFNDWASPVPELIQNSARIIKYGLYDRPQLEPEQWYSPNKGRCILIGDAAHPTSPHLGQGANQALEDCYHLARLLPNIESGSEDILTSEALNAVFSAFARLRQPRTAALVKGARAQGENRVVDGGPEACAARDERLREGWVDEEALERKNDMLLKEPF
jgi:salicylate hydroxylase